MSTDNAGVLPDPMHPDDCDERVSARVDGDRVEELDDLIDEGRFRNRSHAIRFGLAKAIGVGADDSVSDSANDNASDNADVEAR